MNIKSTLSGTTLSKETMSMATCMAGAWQCGTASSAHARGFAAPATRSRTLGVQSCKASGHSSRLFLRPLSSISPASVGSTYDLGHGNFPTGLTNDVWDQQKQEQKYPELKGNVSSEVVVVGAGITGLSIAYKLAHAGKKVVVLEGRTRGSGETGRTTAHIMQWNDDYYYQLIGKFGLDHTKMVAQSHVAALEDIERISKEEKIDCEFRRVPGYLFPWNNSYKEHHVLDMELNACHQVGLMEVSRVDLKGDTKHGKLRDALKFPNCGNFHPLKYINGLAAVIEKHGGKIYENTQVHCATPNGVKLMNGLEVHANDVVLATHSPIHQNLAVHARQEASRTYVVTFDIAKDAVEDAQWWDTMQPYHYVRTQHLPGGKHALIVGGEDHVVGQSESLYTDTYAKLIQWAKQRWDVGDVIHRWTGEVYKPIDQVPLFGPEPLQIQLPGTSKQYIATGHSGQGMTGGTIAGIIISNYILNKPNPWAAAYSPERIVPGVLSPLELASVAQVTLQGYAKRVALTKLEDLRGLVNPRSVEYLAPGEGTVIQEGLQKVALYVNEDGSKSRKSAVCPHLGCLVEWNPMAKTFDCPCHGSVFDRHGKCVHGPATSELPEL